MYIPPRAVLIQARGNFLYGLISHGAGGVAKGEGAPLEKNADT